MYSTLERWLTFMQKEKQFLCTMALGLIIRLVVAPVSGHPWDLMTWKTVGQAFLMGVSPYDVPLYLMGEPRGYNYPPIWALWCALSYLIYTHIPSGFLLNFLLKLPIIVVDTLCGLLIFRLTKNVNALALFYLNPLTIVLGSVWGMFDVIPSYLTLLAFLSLYNKQLWKSALFLSLGIAVKIFPAFLLPLCLIYVYKQRKCIGDSLLYAVLSISIVGLVSLPFLISEGTRYLSAILFHSGRAGGNVTYWHFIWFLQAAFPTTFNEATVKILWGVAFYVFAASFGCIYIYMILKMKDSPRHLHSTLKMGICVFLAFFMTSKLVNEQMLWPLTLLVPYIILSKDRKEDLGFFTLICLIDSIFLFINVPFPAFFGVDMWSLPWVLKSFVLSVFGTMFTVCCGIYLAYLLRRR